MRTLFLLAFALYALSSSPATIYDREIKLPVRVDLDEITVYNYTPRDSALAVNITRAEAWEEPFRGMIAIVNTVRTKMKRYGERDMEKIFVRSQYDGYNAPLFNRTTSQDSIYIEAAMLALKGYRVLPETVEYFANEQASTDKEWIEYISKTTWKKIGKHTFYHNPKRI